MDITKCVNEKCQLKQICLRYTSKPKDNWQSWANFEPIFIDGKLECVNYLVNPAPERLS